MNLIDDNICLYLVGPNDWFENLRNKCEEHGRTYAQYNKKLSRMDSYIIKSIINKKRFIRGYGHVSMRDHKGKAKVEYQLTIRNFISYEGRKSSPNMEVTPSFEWYDKDMGGCKSESDFKYHTWFEIIGVEKISPIDWKNFIRFIPGNKEGKQLDNNDRRLLQYGMFLVYCTHKVETEEEEPTSSKLLRKYESPLKEY